MISRTFHQTKQFSRICFSSCIYIYIHLTLPTLIFMTTSLTYFYVNAGPLNHPECAAVMYCNVVNIDSAVLSVLWQRYTPVYHGISNSKKRSGWLVTKHWCRYWAVHMVNLYLHAHKILISNLPVKSCHLTLIHKQGSRVGKVLENHRSAVIARGCFYLSIHPSHLFIENKLCLKWWMQVRNCNNQNQKASFFICNVIVIKATFFDSDFLFFITDV